MLALACQRRGRPRPAAETPITKSGLPRKSRRARGNREEIDEPQCLRACPVRRRRAVRFVRPGRHQQDEDRLLQQLRRQFLAPGDAEELRHRHPAGGEGRRRRRGGRVHHRRQGGADPGGPDPEPDPAGLQRHRHQRRLARRAERRDQTGLRRGHRRRLLRRHRHRALRLSRRRRLQGHGQAGSRADGEVPAQGREPARNPRPRRHLDRRRHPRRHRSKA